MSFDATWEIIEGDCIEVMAGMDPKSVQCCVTSPPYWGLRDYEVDGQIGLEETPMQYVEKMVEVFRSVWRILRDDGTLWLNIGDSYATGGMGGGGSFVSERKAWRGRSKQKGWRPAPSGRKHKDIMGMPWMVAFALQADGWYLRQDIIWHKPNPMPESVSDRCTKSHEYVFLLTKKPKYYYNMDAIKEPVSGTAHARGNGVNPKALSNGVGWGYAAGEKRKPRCKQNESFSNAVSGLVENRNKRSVWTVPTQSFKGAHFATFPPKLIKPCILAGAPLGGVVFDPFTGAGTTGMVAVNNGRSFIGSELNPDYCKMARDRIQENTRQMRLI